MNQRTLAKIGFVCFITGLTNSGLSQDQPDNYSPFSVVEKGNSIQGSALPQERGCGSGTLAWGNNEYEEVPGIYWAFIRNYCNDGIEITIWTDFTTTLFGSNSEARSQGREVKGGGGSQHSSFNGNRVVSGHIEANARIEYSFSVDSNGVGLGTINDVEYDLQNGTLFLVASHERTVEVRQVNYNLASISSKDITLLATRHPDITNFFSEFHASYQ